MVGYGRDDMAGRSKDETRIEGRNRDYDVAEKKKKRWKEDVGVKGSEGDGDTEEGR